MIAGRFIMRSRMTWMIVLVIGIVALAAARRSILVFMADWLDVGERPRQADYAMVLPGGMERRPFVAIAMVKAGLAKGIITDETETDPAIDAGIAPTGDELLRRVLKLRGIRDDQIHVLPGRANSTWKDAVALAEFMQANPSATIAVVTECFHTRRASWIFHRVLGPEADRIYFVSARLDTVDPKTWWTTEEGLQLYLSEYGKLIFYVATDRSVISIGFTIAVAVTATWFYFRRRLAKRETSEIDDGHEGSAASGIKDGNQSFSSPP